MKYKCLSIAGFDGSGGAGIQADLKTFSALGCYGMNVLTALPVQNTQGVRSCHDIPLSVIAEQLATIFDDITPNAIKIGMLANAQIVSLVANFLTTNVRDIPIIIDPVMFAKSGDALLQPSAIKALRSELIPLATVVTPNIPEAEMLTSNKADQELLAKEILSMGPHAVLIKGGHAEGSQSIDLFLDQSGNKQWLAAERIASTNTHGTGCTLSAAICAFMAQGQDSLSACKNAKDYLHGALKAAQHDKVGKGCGPVHHFYKIWN